MGYTGVITKVGPAELEQGDRLDIYVSFDAYTDSIFDWLGWQTRVEARLDGFYDSDTQRHVGKEGHRERQKLSLGIMPDRTITGVIQLWAGHPTEVLLDAKSLTYLGKKPLIPTPPPPPITPTPPPIPTIFTCQVCGMVFSTADKLVIHRLTHITEAPPPTPPTPPPTPTPGIGLPEIKTEWLVPVLIAGAALLLLLPAKKGE